MAKKLSFLDWSFWLTETRHNPKHVAAFMVLTKPEKAEKDYCSYVVADLKQHTKAYFPFSGKEDEVLLARMTNHEMDYQRK